MLNLRCGCSLCFLFCLKLYLTHLRLLVSFMGRFGLCFILRSLDCLSVVIFSGQILLKGLDEALAFQVFLGLLGLLLLDLGLLLLEQQLVVVHLCLVCGLWLLRILVQRSGDGCGCWCPGGGLWYGDLVRWRLLVGLGWMWVGPHGGLFPVFPALSAGGSLGACFTLGVGLKYLDVFLLLLRTSNVCVYIVRCGHQRPLFDWALVSLFLYIEQVCGP